MSTLSRRIERLEALRTEIAEDIEINVTVRGTNRSEMFKELLEFYPNPIIEERDGFKLTINLLDTSETQDEITKGANIAAREQSQGRAADD
jgi:hypothetical protein